MYAIIRTGGKQYRVEAGAVIDVELLDASLGDQLKFEEVLFVHNGDEPLVAKTGIENYFVKAEVIGNTVGPKVVSLKYKKRQHSRRKWGHRQHYSRVKIVEIGKAH